MGSGSHQAEVYVGSGGEFVSTAAGECSCPDSGTGSGSGGSSDGKVVTASGGGNSDSPACSGSSVRAGGIGDLAPIVAIGTFGTGATASAGILPA